MTTIWLYTKIIRKIYGCFRKQWYPQIIHFNRVFHYKPSILGYPYFWKHPYKSPETQFHHIKLGVEFLWQPWFLRLATFLPHCLQAQSRDWCWRPPKPMLETTFCLGLLWGEDGKVGVSTDIHWQDSKMTFKVSILPFKTTNLCLFSDTRLFVVNNLAVSIKLLSYLQKQQLNI